MIADVITRLGRTYGDNILIRKCGVGKTLQGGRGIAKQDGTPLLYFSQYYADTTNFVEIIDVGDKCKWFKPEHAQMKNGKRFGDSTLCPETADGMNWVDEHFWFIKEELLFPVVFDDEGIKAIGDCIIVEMPEKDRGSLIITPDIIQDKQQVLPVVSVGNKVIEKILICDKIVTNSPLRIFQIADKKYGCLREEDVLCIVE